MPTTTDRQTLLDRARELWRRRLIDLTRNNQLASRILGSWALGSDRAPAEATRWTWTH
jgi:hypothetical protein